MIMCLNKNLNQAAHILDGLSRYVKTLDEKDCKKEFKAIPQEIAFSWI